MKRKIKILFGTISLIILLLLISLYNDVHNFNKITQILDYGANTSKRMGPIDVFKAFYFTQDNALKRWKNKIFKGKTKYWLDTENGSQFLHSESNNSASALYYMVSYKSVDYPFLKWTWRPIRFPDKSGIEDPKLKDDYALRVYVIFASGFFTNFRCVEYLWDEFIPAGTKIDSPYSENIKQLVVRSGEGDGEWVTEERNVIMDYLTLFGEMPRMKIKAIAVMSDSEGSQKTSEANFKEIEIFNKLKEGEKQENIKEGKNWIIRRKNAKQKKKISD